MTPDCEIFLEVQLCGLLFAIVSGFFRIQLESKTEQHFSLHFLSDFTDVARMVQTIIGNTHCYTLSGSGRAACKAHYARFVKCCGSPRDIDCDFS